jgi:hypothetical protein
MSGHHPAGRLLPNKKGADRPPMAFALEFAFALDFAPDPEITSV